MAGGNDGEDSLENPDTVIVPEDIRQYADPRDYVSGKTSLSHTSRMLLLFEGAEHADAPFFQQQIKDRVLEFLNRSLN